MKKKLAMIVIGIALITSFITANAIDAESGFEILFNGSDIGCTYVVLNNANYVPVRAVFENLGAQLFYRSRDNQILALSRDGDIIRHNVGTNTITVNGDQRVFDNPSVLENGSAYIPVDMVSSAFCTDGISFENGQMHIQKQIFNNDYNKIIKDVLDVSGGSNFYPERFHRYLNYHSNNPSLGIQDVIFRVNLGLDYPFYENTTTIEHPYELRVLVNKYNLLPSGFKQYNLVNMKTEYTVNDGKEYLLAGVAYEKYVQMADAAKREGLTMKVVSAYRTEDYQRNLYNYYMSTSGKTHADNYSARPRSSEHQTGLAVDINSVEGIFEYTPEFRWLQKHAHEYGFILRYQKGKEWITGYAYEPWHYRYVGTEAAKIIHDEGITYEEYYAKYVSVNEFK